MCFGCFSSSEVYCTRCIVIILLLHLSNHTPEVHTFNCIGAASSLLYTEVFLPVSTFYGNQDYP